MRRWLRRLALPVVGALALSMLAAGVVAMVRAPELSAALLAAAIVLHLWLMLLFGYRERGAINRGLARLGTRIDRLDRRVRRLARVRDDVRRLSANSRQASDALQASVEDVGRSLERHVSIVGQMLSARVEAAVATSDARATGSHPGTELGVDEAIDRAGEVAALRASPLFDVDHYLALHPGADDDPIDHYVCHGAAAGSDPHPLFHGSWYLARHPEAASWRTPLGHFLTVGASLGFDPHPLFSSRWYADRYLDASFDPIPVEHYLRSGWEAGCDPHPLFDVTWYREQHSRWLETDEEPLTHFLTTGAALGLDPSPSVDIADLTERLLAHGPRDALTTFLQHEGRSASRSMDSRLLSGSGRRDPMADAKWDYLVRRIYERDHDAVLYRIVGNDLPPRHRRGQSLENVRFILEHEPELEGCEKRWILNRITDAEQEAALIELLEAHGQPYLRIPFDEEEYRRIGWRFGDFQQRGLTYRDAYADLPHWARGVAFDHAYQDKNLYVMNNNGARNAALRDGRGRATWVLPWDGNCFVPAAAWQEFRRAVADQPHAKYVVVPMARIIDNGRLLEPEFKPRADEEPQVALRFDAVEEFDAEARYGRRPKVRLFYRIGLEGPWDRWIDLDWEHHPREPGPEAGQWIRSGWVARLFSGQPALESDIKDRGVQRIEAIRNHIDSIDEQLARQRFEVTRAFAMCEQTLEQQRRAVRNGDPMLAPIVDQLLDEARASLEQGPFSVLDKTTTAPSGDPHDYWHPAPYWWPNPDTADGLPYVRRDGHRVPGTEIGGPGSEQYDRTSLQRMFDGSLRLALAWYLTDDTRYAAHGATLIRTWFLDPQTRMNPNLAYAQARLGHDGDAGQPTGIIEMKDLYLVLDAARLLERSGEFSTDDASALRRWLAEYRGWLETSPQGTAERASPNNHGTWYDVQHAAVCAYLDDVHGVLGALKRTDERRYEQYEPSGAQPHEVERSTSFHYCTYNLQAWMVLAQMAQRVGVRLWAHAAGDGAPGIVSGLRWLLPYLDQPWPHRQAAPFDLDRVAVLGHQAEAAEPGMLAQLGIDLPPAHTMRPVFSVHDGIRPFWQLGIPGLEVTAGALSSEV